MGQVLYLCSNRCFHLRVEQKENAQKKKAEICLLWQAMNIESNIQCFLIQGRLRDYEYDKHQILKILNKITKYYNMLLKYNTY